MLSQGFRESTLNCSGERQLSIKMGIISKATVALFRYEMRYLKSDPLSVDVSLF